MERTVRLGAGAGFSGDRFDPALALAERGKLDFLVFECLGERTIAHAVEARARNPETAGYDPLLELRMSAILPACARNRVKIISNMGAANPVAAARKIAEIGVGLGLRVAAVTGDALPTHGAALSSNAYTGCDGIVEALVQGADIVITGRTADPALFLGPLVYAFKWRLDDWQLLGRGTAIGHLLECAGQLTGGYFADPGYKEVARLADLGFPYADVDATGGAVFSSLPEAGGAVTVPTCKEQLLYEVFDPSRYETPDVTADFTSIRFDEIAPGRIVLAGGGGSEPPAQLKVSTGHHEGWLGEAQISYGGPGCVSRGRLALAIVRERLSRLSSIGELHCDLIGVDSVWSGAQGAEPNEVRARVTARALDESAAAMVGREVEALYTNGPASGGGVTRSVRPIVGITSGFVARSLVKQHLHWEEPR